MDADADAQSTRALPRRDLPRELADVVSVASDFGIVWVLVTALQVVRRQRSVAGALLRLGAAGVASLVLTRLLKHFFAIPRDTEGAASTRARTPSSPSFPSGHTLAAFTSALTIPTCRRGRLLALCFASLVAWSRVHVGHHRPVDVVAGAGVGAVTGGVLRVVLPA